MYTNQNLRRSQHYYNYLFCSKGPLRVYIFWMLWSLSSFWAHYRPLTKRKVPGRAANTSQRLLYQSGVVQNQSFLGVGVYFWSWITQILTLAPSRILIYTIVLPNVLQAPVINRRQLGASEESLVHFTLRYIYCAQRMLLNALDLSAIRWFAEFPY